MSGNELTGDEGQDKYGRISQGGSFRGPRVYPLLDAMASLFAQAYQLARIRVLESGSQVL